MLSQSKYSKFALPNFWPKTLRDPFLSELTSSQEAAAFSRATRYRSSIAPPPRNNATPSSNLNKEKKAFDASRAQLLSQLKKLTNSTSEQDSIDAINKEIEENLNLLECIAFHYGYEESMTKVGQELSGSKTNSITETILKAREPDAIITYLRAINDPNKLAKFHEGAESKLSHLKVLLQTLQQLESVKNNKKREEITHTKKVITDVTRDITNDLELFESLMAQHEFNMPIPETENEVQALEERWIRWSNFIDYKEWLIGRNPSSLQPVYEQLYAKITDLNKQKEALLK